jgi:hypothetical protein
MMRRVVPVVVAVLAVGCGGSTPATTAEVDGLRDGRALDFAVSAGRALEGTRFADLGARTLADLLVDLCEALPDAPDPDRATAEALATVAAPAGPPGDDGIFGEVVAAGLAEVCPEVVLDVVPTDAEEGGEGAYLAAVLPHVDASGLREAPGRDVLLDAGVAVCTALDESEGAEQAALAAIELLFGVAADSVADLSAGGALAEPEGAVAGAVLAGASSFLCPEHRSTVLDYVSGEG